VTIARVRVGDPRTRWGSCSSSGDIAYSWRLILMPPAVREATVAHEVAHRLHMNHGPDFHAAVAHLLGREPKAERAWLRANAARIHGVGRVE
jgi:predicted metal-dependent hydrolase